jgi:hypothetical protein
VLNAAALGAVVFMSAWVAHLCLRCRPNWIVVVINVSFWVVPVALLMAATGQALRGFGLGTALVFVLQRLHWLKWKYTSNTWTVADIRMFVDRANWFVVRLYPFVAGFAAACVLCLALSWLLLPEGRWLAGTPGPCYSRGTDSVRRPLSPPHEFDLSIQHLRPLEPSLSTSSLGYRPTVVGDSRLFRSAARLPVRAPRRRSPPTS